MMKAELFINGVGKTINLWIYTILNSLLAISMWEGWNWIREYIDSI